MPFTRTQSILKKLLPRWCFTPLYELAHRGYIVWCKISDELYYLLFYSYHALKRDSMNVKRIRTVYLIRSHTMVGRTGLLATYDIASEVEKSNADGCFVECGVARGGCSALMAMVANENKRNRKVWLFDSFEGLPEPTSKDKPDVTHDPGQDRSSSALQKGYCLGTYGEVSNFLFSKLGLDKENVFIVEGWFQNTLPSHKDKIRKISFLRIDADWYESTKCCLENLYDNVVTGGYIFVDDYSLTGCKKAVDDFLKKKGLDVRFTFDNRGGAYFVKPY
ncbi:TylF/MycF/NovP-related O-methyltransferase [Chloroflexota bacterium]